jgi:SAM-dependent methyltransferase
MRDLVEEGLDLPPETIDVFTIFDSMEHWHHSPKPVFGAVMRALRPGGLFVLSGPNCANLRKRITLLFGRGKWSAMHDWYDAPRFRGHVREPDVEDLRYIARDMDLTQVRILGRNWAGWGSRLRLFRIITCREKANIDAGLGFIWRISVEGHSRATGLGQEGRKTNSAGSVRM